MSELFHRTDFDAQAGVDHRRTLRVPTSAIGQPASTAVVEGMPRLGDAPGAHQAAPP